MTPDLKQTSEPVHLGTLRLRRPGSLLCALALLTGNLVSTDSQTLLAQEAVATAKPAHTPVYQVQRYEITGSTALSQANINQVLQGATGTNISLPQIRQALLKLQQAYRDRGFTNVAVTLPRQSLSDGVIKVTVHEGTAPAKTAATEIPAWTAQQFDIRHFEIHGNTALTGEEIDTVLSPIARTDATLEQIKKALAKLQEAYRAKGYLRATVTLPQQLLTDGRVTVKVSEGDQPSLAKTIQPLETSPTPATPPVEPVVPKFEVQRYEVTGNTLLSQNVIDSYLTNAIGAEVTLPQIQTALGNLQLGYRERGYATVSVALPQQQLTNATVKVQVTEGKLVDIRVSGNRYFSTNNVLNSLPSLRTNTLLNSRIFQYELDIANQNRDRQIYPTIIPGPEPGTSALTLKVKDRLPLHGRIDLNNHSTPGTPDWRINASASYNNLWQKEHQFGLSYGFTPEEFKEGGIVTDYLFNRPLIANYGAYYRMPFGEAKSTEDIINSSGSFGYDEATRQFRLPPAGARPDITVFASASSSDTGIKYSNPVTVAQTPLLTILSRDSGQDLTINEGLGARVSVPYAISDTKRLSFSAGLDLKRYELQSFNTNNFLITTVVTNAQGSQTIFSEVNSPQPARYGEIIYLPISFGLDYSQKDASGTLSASLGYSYNFLGDNSEFSTLAYSAKARSDYHKVTLSVTRDQIVFKDWSLLMRANGQLSAGALINNEQFAIGGLNSIRGYYEGDEYGDIGWVGSTELRTPFIPASFAGVTAGIPVWLRGCIFVDFGQRYLLEDARIDQSQFLAGTGFGLSANFNNHVDARLTLGWPLVDSLNTQAYEPRAYFSLGGQF